MANYTTRAQRYNARMDKIFSEAKRLKTIYCGHSEHPVKIDGVCLICTPCTKGCELDAPGYHTINGKCIPF